MTWRPAQSLRVLHAQLQAAVPGAAPPATSVNEWGLIGDAAHDPTSDHAPHDFPGWGTEIVTAADFPNRPDLGLDAFRVLDDIRRSRDPRAKYGISNGHIFSNHAVTGYAAWMWRPYTGSDPHTNHGHLSVVGDNRADGTQPWATIGGDEEDDMGQSFGPILMRTDDNLFPMSIPPAEAGIADPRKTWLNINADLYGQAPIRLRIWVGKGDGVMSALPGHPDGVVEVASCKTVSAQLDPGVRFLSVSRVAGQAPVSFCFERK